MATSSSVPNQTDLASRTSELLRHLWELPNRPLGIPIADLPASLRSEELITRCVGEGFIHFGFLRQTCDVDKGFYLRWETYHFSNNHPYSSTLKEALSGESNDRIRLTATGEIAACRIRNGAELADESAGNGGRPQNESAVPAATTIINCDDIAKAITAELERSPKAHAKAQSKSISVVEAHSLLVKLVKDSPAYNEFTREQLATLVAGKTGKNCSPATISNTHYWKTHRRHERGKKGACHPTAVGKSMLEDVATKDNVVRGRGYEATSEEAMRRIKKSRLDKDEQTSLLVQLDAGTIDATRAIEIVDVTESS